MSLQTIKLNSVEKALNILQSLNTRNEGMGTGELSVELGFSTPTVSRLLNVLSKHDFVRKNPTGNKYVLGKSVLDIGRFASRHMRSQMVSIAKPYIDKLRDTVGESAMLEIMEGESAMVAYRASGQHVVGILVRTGTMIPAHVSPGAKAMMAFSPPQIVDGILRKTLPSYTPKTITDPDVLKKNLEKIRRKGIALATGEYSLDVNTMGAPVLNHENKPVAAVVISMPAFRAKYHKQQKIEALLKETAVKLSDHLRRYRI